jgi:hypothetical protein
MSNNQKKFKKNHSKIRDVSTNFNAQTIYIGKRGENIDAMLRIYDKKAEQLGSSKR